MILKKLLKERTALYLHLEEIKLQSGVLEKEEALEKLDTKIKDLARASSPAEIEKANDGVFCVSVIKAYRKWYDFKLIKVHADPKEMKLIQDNALNVEVDKGRFEELVQGGLVRRELKQRAFCEEEMTPRVSILPVKKQQDE